MSSRSGMYRTAVTAVLVIGVVALGAAGLAGQATAQIPTPGQFPSYNPPRTADGKPNLNGIWQALGTADWDIEAHQAKAGPYTELLGGYIAEPGGQGIVEGGTIPYQPSALARKKQNFEKRAMPSVPGDGADPPAGDPELKCFMPGVPRAMYMPYPLQIVQTPDFVLITHEFNGSTRLIRMNWKEESPIDNSFFMGWNRGRWEGDTLVVDVTGLNSQNWLDRAGNFYSENVHIVERFTLASPYHIMYEATIEDPTVYTRPWKIAFPLYRRMDKNVQLMEFKCVPFVEELLYGRFTKRDK